MIRHRVLCVSSDRSTRAAVTRSFVDTSVTVLVAQSSAAAVDRLEGETVDAVVVDASTVEDVARLVATVESTGAQTQVFVTWGEPVDPAGIVSQVIARDGVDDADVDGDGDCGEDPFDGAEAEPSIDATRSVDSDRHPVETGNEKGPAQPAEGQTPTATRRESATGSRTDYERLVDTVKNRLADARSPVAIERTIREAFVADDRFVFAWIGEYDRGEREIVPWLTDASALEWPMQRTFPIGDGEQPVLERTLQTREIQTVQHVAADPGRVPLGEAAIERDVESLLVAPLATDDDIYGVLAVYALDPFTPTAIDAVRSIVDTASYALQSIAVRGQLDQQNRVLERYERLVETAGDGMFVLGNEGHLTTVNDALLEMTGYSREGLLGEHISLLFGPESVEATGETIESLLRSNRSTDTVEVVLETKDGKTIPCETQLAILAGNGRYKGAVGVVRDVTDRKRRERRLQEQNERLDAFARIVSHDLRNPLGVSQGYLDLLAETESFEYLEKVREGLDRMEAIVADVLAIAREGEGAVEPESLSLSSVAQAAWENVSTEDGELVVESSESIEADRSRLLRLLENLFRNAIEHGTPAEPPASGPAITVRVGTLERSDDPTAPVGFYVEDDGRGLPAEFRERIFDSSFTTSATGHGIGLWVVREVATSHGWVVTATESDDGGARFEFSVAETDLVL